MEISVSRHLLWSVCLLKVSVWMCLFLSLENLKKLLKIRPMPLTWDSFPSSMPVNWRFGFFFFHDCLVVSVYSLLVVFGYFFTFKISCLLCSNVLLYHCLFIFSLLLYPFYLCFLCIIHILYILQCFHLLTESHSQVLVVSVISIKLMFVFSWTYTQALILLKSFLLNFIEMLCVCVCVSSLNSW